MTSIEQARLDASGTFQQLPTAVVKASYIVSLKVAKTKDSTHFGESLINARMSLVLGVKTSEKLRQMSFALLMNTLF